MTAHDTTRRLRQALAARHDEGWAYFEEVDTPDPDARGRWRRADALAIGLWRSRGHDVHGFEIKADRRDWLRELDDPSKAEAVARWCAHWWIVTVPDVVRNGELPSGWGLMVLGKRGLRVRTQAPRQDHVEPLSPAMWVRLIKKLRDRPSADQIVARVRAAEARGEQRALRRAHLELAGAPRELAELRERVTAFEQASGMELGVFGTERARAVGRAAALVARGGLDAYVRELEWLAATVRRESERLDEHRGAVARAASRLASVIASDTIAE